MTRAFSQPSAAPPAKPASGDLYRAVWRWHFYAGLLVLPFLILLAVTGALYLFRDEIDTAVHADLKRVPYESGAVLASPSALVAAALANTPGTAVKYTTPAQPDLSAEVTIKTAAGDKRAVYVDPYRAQVLGTLPDRGTVMWTVRHLHSLRLFGPVTRGLIEITGGWTILLIMTGIYLWWPRGQGGGVVSLRGTPKARVFWRDLHAVTGLTIGAILLFLAVTGLPWSGVWGAKVNEWANGNNFGYPAGVRVAVPMSDEHLNHLGHTTWSLDQAKVPQSSASPTQTTAIGLDNAVAIFDGLGLYPGYAVALPTTPTGVYSGSVYPDDLSRQRVVHLDQYSGKPLIDMSYADYGPLGKTLEFGINVHMGQQFGLANQLILLVVCAGIVVLAVSAGVMWWKRRPRGSLGVPPLPADKRVLRGLVGLLVLGGLAFPLTGLSLLVMLGLDWLITRRPRRRLA
ncbi:PepSY-associated TM helix domain-containing protein [Rhodospirillum rubrum]|uniref:Sulfite reductase n=1 Tax=Rhodospirillum rubrum (strain ATCC 11170 / ATH 1.1.1 / DSM 467 / LMG 4362 / NCIMB 8255 / S1) TaxID=269796 RepID=Q2RPK6_RHORT|nr:PepSY domain-containing protein [Rhodospirillum rubrum]ABC23939.1 sulfite reductase [Rhodospirillum rubrum ATCC 11170]AEO49683.1 sulfite reductase [Rhodospirillum rubrum F11]MBK5955598.1 PepSY domain-containing protein [Rhodospirillum rubrum]QXG79883.1 PepSY domain-containing protein [Rhodospirillum rubrum]HCF18502.1 PepSY domain-containing protein [Rhodospirillum rubrum]